MANIQFMENKFMYFKNNKIHHDVQREQKI